MKIIPLLCVLALVSVSSAAVNVTLPPSSCANNTDILAVLNNLPGCITESALTAIASGMVYASQQFMDSALNFVTATPDLHWFCGSYNQVMALLESLYTVALMGVGFYYLIQAPDVEGRIRAKQWLKDVFFMILLLTFSYYLFDALLSLDSYLTTSLFNSSMSSIFSTNISFVSLIFALIMISSLLFAAIITFFTLLIRYLLIPFLLLLFPISIFLYFMPFGRQWGSSFLKATVLIIFMSAIDALFLFAFSALLNTGDPNLLDPFVKSTAIFLGFGLVGFLNIALFIAAILTVLSPVFESLGPLKWIGLPVLYAML